jgi:predicted transcriptional regulator
MSIRVTVELPDELAQRARAVADRTQRRLEDVLVEWLDRAGAEAPVDELPDDQVLALCDSQLETLLQDELSDLLARNREGSLPDEEQKRLDELMHVYRRGLVRKAQAFKTAVARGLRPRLD